MNKLRIVKQHLKNTAILIENIQNFNEEYFYYNIVEDHDFFKLRQLLTPLVRVNANNTSFPLSTTQNGTTLLNKDLRAFRKQNSITVNNTSH